LSLVFVAVLVFFPVVPYPVLAGTIGSIFGVSLGVSISLVGIMVGTMTMFLLARYGFHDLGRKMLVKYPTVQDYESFFERNAFAAIIYARLIPVIPAPLVTVISALSKVKWGIFFTATFIGKIPAVVTFTFAGSIFEGSKGLSIGIFAIYFLVILTAVYFHLHKKQAAKLA